MKAQDFIKQHAPKYEGSDTIPYHAVLALMESFKSHCMIEYLDTLLKPKPNESVILDAVIDEDKMTLPYKVGDRFTNGIEVDFYDKSIAKYWCKKSTGGTSFYLASELDQFTLIDNDLPHVEHTGI